MKFINHFIHTLLIAATFSTASFAMDDPNQNPHPQKNKHNQFFEETENSRKEDLGCGKRRRRDSNDQATQQTTLASTKTIAKKDTNQTPPLSVLPIEILKKIFFYLNAKDQAQFIDAYKGMYPLRTHYSFKENSPLDSIIPINQAFSRKTNSNTPLTHLKLVLTTRLTSKQIDDIIKVIPASIKNLIINLGDNFDGTHVAAICKRLTKLTSLDLTGCSRLINPIINCPLLTSLNLRGCTILTNPTINCPLLTSLNFYGCRELTNPIINCPALTSLDLSWHTELTDQAITNIHCPALTSLNLSWCRGLTNPTINCPLLTSLNLSWCTRLTNPIINCPALTSLDLSCCTELTDQAITNIHCPALTSLNLRDCTRLTDPIINRPLLTSLDLRGCRELTNPIINCPALTSLNLRDCTRLTDQAITNIHCPALTSLNLRGCTRLNNQAEILAQFEFAQF